MVLRGIISMWMVWITFATITVVIKKLRGHNWDDLAWKHTWTRRWKTRLLAPWCGHGYTFSSTMCAFCVFRRHPLLLRWLFLHFISILKALPYVSGAKKLKTCDSGQVRHVHTWIQWNWGRRQTPKIHTIHMAVAVMPMCENELK